jgi:HEAT repeat protein
MTAGRTVFDILRTEQDPAADAALLAAIKDADPATAQAIVETLLTRNTKEALVGLVHVFHLLDESLRQAVLIEWERIFSVLREACQARLDQVRLNVLEIIRRACIYRAAYLVDGCLRARSPNVRTTAARTLAFLADELLKTSVAPVREADLAAMGPEEIRSRMAELDELGEDRRQLAAALEQAMTCYDLHAQPQVVESALWMLDDMGPAFWSTLTVPGSRQAQAAVRCLQPGMGPRMVPFAMVALCFAEFRPFVVKALAAGTDPQFLEEWMRQSWRLAQPKMARAMGALKDLACTANHGWELLQLPGAAQRHMARWILATGIAHPDKVDLLKELQRQGDRAGRRSALWTLAGIHDAKVNEILHCINDPEDPEARRIARRELARRSPGEMPLNQVLATRDTHRPTPGSPGKEVGATPFERYWRMFDALGPEEREVAGQDMVAATPEFEQILTRRLTSSEHTDRIRALQMVVVLGRTEAFQERLYQLCHDPMADIRSAAVAALAPLKNPISRRLLNRALNDPDLRVQANAVEAVAASGHEAVAEQLMSKLSSPDNRVQANAVKALLKLGVREAAETLLKMLAHPNRMHRISALWLVERMGLFTLVSRVAGMATEDPDPAVRKRAHVLAHGGSAEMPPAEAAPEPAATAEPEVTVA